MSSVESDAPQPDPDEEPMPIKEQNYESFLSWMSSLPHSPEKLEEYSPQDLLNLITEDEIQTPAHEWAFRFLNGQTAEEIAKDKNPSTGNERTRGSIVIAMSGLAQKLAQK